MKAKDRIGTWVMAVMSAVIWFEVYMRQGFSLLFVGSVVVTVSLMIWVFVGREIVDWVRFQAWKWYAPIGRKQR